MLCCTKNSCEFCVWHNFCKFDEWVNQHINTKDCKVGVSYTTPKMYKNWCVHAKWRKIKESLHILDYTSLNLNGLPMNFWIWLCFHFITPVHTCRQWQIDSKRYFTQNGSMFWVNYGKNSCISWHSSWIITIPQARHGSNYSLRDNRKFWYPVISK